MHKWVAILGAFLFVLPLSADDRDGEAKFKELMDAGRYAEAADLSAARSREMPKEPARLFNAGLSHALAGRHAAALGYFRNLLEIEPDDVLTASKIVQSLEALNRAAEIEPAIQRVREIRKRLLARGEKVDTAFTREQFSVAGKPIMAREFYEMSGEMAVKWSFLVLDEKGKATRRISLGSYDFTTNVARETGEIKPDERLYHLDDYEGPTHRTLGFYKKCPSYRETRKAVQDYLEGKKKPISGTTATGP